MSAEKVPGSSMNKKQFAAELAETHDLTPAEATALMDAVFDTLIRTLVTRKADRVAITGVGVFERVKYKAKNAWNLHTNSRLRIEERIGVRFRAGTAFKAMMRGEQPLPDGRNAALKAAKRKIVDSATPEDTS